MYLWTKVYEWRFLYKAQKTGNKGKGLMQLKVSAVEVKFKKALFELHLTKTF